MPPPRAALLAASAHRPAAKRQRTGPYTGIPRVRVAVEEAPDDDGELLVARLRLLEGFVGRPYEADRLRDAEHLAQPLQRQVRALERQLTSLTRRRSAPASR